MPRFIVDKHEAIAMLKGGIDGIRDWNRLRFSNLIEVDLTRIDFRGIDLSTAALSNVNLDGCDFVNADLTNCDLHYSSLNNADCRGAMFHGAYLLHTEIIRSLFDGADFEGAIFGGTQIDSYLNGADNLNNTKHRSESSISWRSLLAFDDQVPQAFLRGVGLSQEDIAYLIGRNKLPIKFYDCVISYSTKDESFASALHRDLQSRGIRCWKWDHDMRIGGTIVEEFSEAIKVNQRVILLLSKASLCSPAVLREIERIIQEEDRRISSNSKSSQKVEQHLLFPIALDGYIFRMQQGNPVWNHARRPDVVAKMVCNAIGWKRDRAKYNVALSKILKDLQSRPSIS